MRVPFGDLKAQTLKGWVQFAGMEILIRHLNQTELQKINKAATKVVFDAKGKPSKELDPIASNKLFGLAAIEDWRGLEDEAGQPIPCTPENIETMMNGWADFASFVVTKALDIQALQADEKAATIKNSETTSDQ